MIDTGILDGRIHGVPEAFDEGKIMVKKMEVRDEGKARFELRFDAEVYEGIKRLADEAQISVNQLMHGLGRWAVRYGHAGQPTRDEHGIIASERQPGCVWFGEEAVIEERFDDREQEMVQVSTPGTIRCFLDFTERRVVREDEPPKAEQKKAGKK